MCQLSLAEPYYIWTCPDGKKQLICMTLVKPAVLGKEYLLIFEISESDGDYHMVGDYQGIFEVPDDGIKAEGENNSPKELDMDRYYDWELLHYPPEIYVKSWRNISNKSNFFPTRRLPCPAIISGDLPVATGKSPFKPPFFTLSVAYQAAFCSESKTLLICASLYFLVTRLTTGTTAREASMAMAPIPGTKTLPMT